jgi:hypothetical protein
MLRSKLQNEFVQHHYFTYYTYPVEKDVWHVDTSGLPQFTAKEENVIRLN